MEIKKLFGTQESAQSVGFKKSKDALTKYDQGRAAGSAAGEDVVRISPLSLQLSQVSQVLREDEESRAKRVQDLKSQVESGSYNVSSTDVAKSLVSFARDLPPTGDV